MKPAFLTFTRIAINVLLLTAALAAAPAVRADSALPVLVQPGDRIAVFGDSISTGKGYGYLAVQLMNQDQPSLHLTWFDNGHPFWRSDTALKAVDQVLADKPTLVTIMFGTNDLGGGGAYGVAEYPKREKLLVDRFKAAGVRIVLLTPPYASNETRSGASLNNGPLPTMGEELFALGAQEHVPVFDMYTAMWIAFNKPPIPPSPGYYGHAGDVHPNAAGHALMARALANFLEGISAPPRTPYVWRHPTEPSFDAPFADQGPSPDQPIGVDPSLLSMTIDNAAQVDDPSRWKGPSDLSAKVQASWNNKFLFLTADVTDSVVAPGDTQPAWTSDGIEFFVDTRQVDKRTVAYSPGYFQFLAPVQKQDGKGAIYGSSEGELDGAACTEMYAKRGDGYAISVTVPWSSLGITPHRGDELGFDAAINDLNDPKAGRYKMLWRGWGDDYLNAGSLGSIVLR